LVRVLRYLGNALRLRRGFRVALRFKSKRASRAARFRRDALPAFLLLCCGCNARRKSRALFARSQCFDLCDAYLSLTIEAAF
jgi:hypothetical protein